MTFLCDCKILSETYVIIIINHINLMADYFFSYSLSFLFLHLNLATFFRLLQLNLTPSLILRLYL